MNILEDEREVFAKNLKKYMDVQGVDRTQLANALNISYTTVCGWLNCQIYPRLENLIELANFFKISKAELTEQLEYNGNLDSNVDRDIVMVNVLGKIPAGVPFEVIEDAYTLNYVNIPSSWVKGGKEYFALKIVGDSMEPQYHDGDTVVFLKTCDFTSGKDCCVRINGNEATFKRVIIRDDGLLISPLNINNSSGFVPKFYSKEEVEKLPVEIIGIKKRHIIDDDDV